MATVTNTLPDLSSSFESPSNGLASDKEEFLLLDDIP